MHQIELKSTGFLIDERITAGFKANLWSTAENIRRVADLDAAIEDRVQDRWTLINPLLVKLERILKECWDAQEVVMATKLTSDTSREDLYILAVAGKKAQSTNAARNKIVREIDKLLGESDTTTLEKTYG